MENRGQNPFGGRANSCLMLKSAQGKSRFDLHICRFCKMHLSYEGWRKGY